MRILHILDHSVPLHSGYAFRTLAILAQQRALGWTTAQITSAKHTGATAVEEVVDGFTFHRTLPSGSVVERLPVLDQLAVIKGLTRRLLEVIGEVQPEILHAHSPSLNGLAALIAGRRRRLPVVYEVRALWEDGAVDHGTSQADSWRYRASRALETLVLRRADAVTTICEGLRGEIAARGVPRRAIAVIPNGVDTGQFTVGGPPDRVLTRSLGLDGARVLGFGDEVAIARQAPRQEIAIGGIVIDDQDAAGLRMPSGRLGSADRGDVSQHIAHDLDGRRRNGPARPLAERDQAIDIGEQVVRLPEYRPEILEERLMPAVLRLFEQQLAITFDGIQRCSQFVAQFAAIRLFTETVRCVKRRTIDDPLDQ